MSGDGSLLHFARDAETNKIILAMRLCIRALRTTTQHEKGVGPDHAYKEGRRSADRRTVHVRAAQTSVRELAQLICCAAAALVASRSPFGAPPRHSPGRTHPPLAQLQFPRFLRPGLAGVTRFACLELPSSSETGRHAGRAVAQSRPGAVCETARGHRTRSASRSHPECALR